MLLRRYRIQIIGVALSAAIFFSFYHVISPAQAPDQGETPVGLSLGDSGEGNLTKPTLGISSEDTSPLGMSLFRAGEKIPVETFNELRQWIQNASGDIQIELYKDIFMEGNITVPKNIVVTVDGRGEHSIDQVYTYRFYAKSGSTVTLKNMEVIGRYEYGIVQHYEANGTAIYDNITYSGPQPYYSSGLDGHLIIRNGGSYNLIKQPNGWSNDPQELCENRYLTFEGGEVAIYHAWTQRDPHSIFFITNGSGRGQVKLTGGAQVTVRSKNYVYYTGTGGAAYILEDGTSLDIVAGGFNLGTGHPITEFTMGEDAFFSYRQEGVPYETGAMRAMYITGDITVGNNSTFLYESSVGIRNQGKLILHSPKLVSLYGDNAAFSNDQREWIVNDVNAVNYWNNKNGDASPSKDNASNWPDYMWNTWYVTDSDVSKLGPAFSFSGSLGKGIDSGGNISEALGRSASSLKDIFRFQFNANTTPSRIVIGNLGYVEVEKINTSSGQITGRATCSDIMAEYEMVDGGFHSVANEGLPLSFQEENRPKSGGRFSIVANMDGLRAALKVESHGVLELLAAPGSIYYGEHELPSSMTVYGRVNDQEGQMAILVADSRGALSSPWEIVLEAMDQAIPGKEQLPPSALIFVTQDGRELTLREDGAVVVYQHGKALEEYEEHNLVWNKEHGLLIKGQPGALDAGNYATILNWTLQPVVDES